MKSVPSVVERQQPASVLSILRSYMHPHATWKMTRERTWPLPHSPRQLRQRESSHQIQESGHEPVNLLTMAGLEGDCAELEGSRVVGGKGSTVGHGQRGKPWTAWWAWGTVVGLGQRGSRGSTVGHG
jgi:hypothetical protein